MTTQPPRSIADIVKQAAIDVAEGKLMPVGKKRKGAFDGDGIMNLRGVPQGIVPFVNTGGYNQDYFGFLADADDHLLSFRVEDEPTLASLLKVAEQNHASVEVDGHLHSTGQKMYELIITSVVYGGIEIRTK